MENYFRIFFGYLLTSVDKYGIMHSQENKENKMTAQIQNVIRRLAAHHGYSAVFVENLGYGIYLYSFGGIVYRIRGDGTIL